MRRLAPVLLLLCACRTAPAEATSPPPPSVDFAKTRREARAAYVAGDMPGFLVASRLLVDAAPNHPGALYNLACALAKNHDPSVAAPLSQLVAMGVFFDLTAEADFASVRAEPWFQADVAAMARIETLRVGNGGEVLARLAERDLTTEGIARDERTSDVFVSSVHRRKIVRIAKDGAAHDFTAASDGLDSVLGLDVDPARRLLYACTAAIPEMMGYTKTDENRAAVVAFDLDTRQKKLQVPLSGAGKHMCNDLAVDRDGSVLVSDTGANALLRLAPGATTMTTLVAAGALVSPQGIAARDEGLYVADYGRGIARVNRARGELTFLHAPATVPLSGIDGLRAEGDGFVAIQNGVRPNRIVRLHLSGDTLSAEVLAENDRRWNEPTLGIIAQGALVYVGASQWGAFDEAGRLKDEASLVEPILLRLPLGPAR